MCKRVITYPFIERRINTNYSFYPQTYKRTLIPVKLLLQQPLTMNNIDQYYYNGDESDSSSWETESEEDIYYQDGTFWNSNLFNTFCYNHALHIPRHHLVQPPSCSK